MCMAIRGTEEVGFKGEGFVEMVASSYCLMGNRNTAGRPWAKRGIICGCCLLSSASLQG